MSIKLAIHTYISSRPYHCDLLVILLCLIPGFFFHLVLDYLLNLSIRVEVFVLPRVQTRQLALLDEMEFVDVACRVDNVGQLQCAAFLHLRDLPTHASQVRDEQLRRFRENHKRLLAE